MSRSPGRGAVALTLCASLVIPVALLDVRSAEPTQAAPMAVLAAAGPSAITSAPGAAANPIPSAQEQPALLGAYRFQNPQPDWAEAVYRPRQFVAGQALADPTWGSQTVGDPGPYAGWDVLTTPNDGLMRVLNYDWLTLTLNRPATLAVVWRRSDGVAAWLRDWTPGAPVVVDGVAEPTFTTRAGPGEVTLGAVYGPGEDTGMMRDTYWVLLAEADGRPTPPPPVPAGREVPRPNETCPAWVHDRYTTTGPDGKTYPTWHPQIDPVYWCYFRHEHGSDPALFAAGYQPLYGYVSAVGEMVEGHQGFKSYVFEDGQGHSWLITHHFGTASVDRVCARFHSVDIAVADVRSKELLADLHLMADFGKAIAVDYPNPPLAPRACPDQATRADADGSTGVREIPIVVTDAHGYEPWRFDASGNVLGLMGDLTFNTTNHMTRCDSLTCEVAVPTGGDGSARFLQTGRDFGLVAGPNAGTFFSDAHGLRLMAAGQPGAVQQYVRPGLSVSLVYLGDQASCGSTEPWSRRYSCGLYPGTGPAPNLEGALRGPN